jgi:hypothetical protein
MMDRFQSHPDELLSASLTEELSDAERTRVNAHLATCERCRSTLAAFTDQRRLLSGMRHAPAPRELGTRVSTAIAAAPTEEPWWRRPAAVVVAFSGAAVAAAVLLAVVLIGVPTQPQVAASGEPTGSPDAESEPPNATMTAAPSPGVTPEPAPEPVLGRGNTGYLSMTGTNANPELSLRRQTPQGEDETVVALAPTNQPPVAAVLSPDGQWLAYQTFSWGKGTNHAWLVRLTDGHTIDLGETPGDAFGEQMAWFGASKTLMAYTGLTEEPAGATTDVWVADTVTGQKVNVTHNGAAYVGSFIPNTDLLWLSVAGGPGDPGGPNSFLVDLTPTDAGVAPVDLSQEVDVAEGVFQPILNATGDRVIFWRGFMAGEPQYRYFDSSGTLYVEEAVEGGFSWVGQPMFENLVAEDTVAEPNLLTSASFSWAPDGDTFAVWRVQFGGQTPAAGTFPHPALLYVGRVSTGELSRDQSFSYGDQFVGVPETQIIDVGFAEESGGGTVLLVTVQLDAGSEGNPDAPVPSATVIRVSLADESEESLGPEQAWNGPALWVAPDDAGG